MEQKKRTRLKTSTAEFNGFADYNATVREFMASESEQLIKACEYLIDLIGKFENGVRKIQDGKGER